MNIIKNEVKERERAGSWKMLVSSQTASFDIIQHVFTNEQRSQILTTSAI